MFQPSPAARTTKRQTRKSAPIRKPSAQTNAAPIAAEAVPAYLPCQARLVGIFVRRSAARIAAEIAEAAADLEGFILLCDGDAQTGLHEIRAAMMDLRSVIQFVTRTAMNVKVRGEAGHTDV